MALIFRELIRFLKTRAGFLQMGGGSLSDADADMHGVEEHDILLRMHLQELHQRVFGFASAK